MTKLDCGFFILKLCMISFINLKKEIFLFQNYNDQIKNQHESINQIRKTRKTTHRVSNSFSLSSSKRGLLCTRNSQKVIVCPKRKKDPLAPLDPPPGPP